MTYEITDEFLDKVDGLLDSVMEASKNSDTLDGAGVVLVSLEKFENMKQLASELCDAMEDGFPDYEEEKEVDENEEDTEEGSGDCDNNRDPVHLDPDCDGSGYVAY